MAKKYSALEKEQQKLIKAKADIQSQLLGIDSWDGVVGNTNGVSKFGLCVTCQEFLYAKSEFRVKAAKCRDLEIVLNQDDPVTECTQYIKKGQLSLNEMYEMAEILEIDKEKVGFTF